MRLFGVLQKQWNAEYIGIGSMNKFYRVISIFIIILIGLGLIPEVLFWVNSSQRFKEQRLLNNYVESVSNDHNGQITVFQLFEDTLIFKISSCIGINDMEDVVIKFEEYGLSVEGVSFIRRIKFIDEDVEDTLIPRMGNCVIEFTREDSYDFRTINIYDIDEDSFPSLYDFSSYQYLLRSYDFNIFSPVKLDETDDLSVINRWYCSPDTYCNGEYILLMNGTEISEERCGLC